VAPLFYFYDHGLYSLYSPILYTVCLLTIAIRDCREFSVATEPKVVSAYHLDDSVTRVLPTPITNSNCTLILLLQFPIHFCHLIEIAFFTNLQFMSMRMYACSTFSFSEKLSINPYANIIKIEL
jgi:hypothetical protein